MISISVKADIDRFARDLDRQYVKQLPFATAKALTDTAKDVQAAETKALPEVFDRPTPFTMRAFAIRAARKNNLTATIYVRPIQAGYLRLEIEGGTLQPKKRALVLPTDLPTNQYGSIPKGAVRRLLARPDVFSGKVRGVAGIWQRTPRGLLLLISYAPRATYRKLFPFYEIGERVAKQRIEPNFRKAWAQAVATAR